MIIIGHSLLENCLFSSLIMAHKCDYKGLNGVLRRRMEEEKTKILTVQTVSLRLMRYTDGGVSL